MISIDQGRSFKATLKTWARATRFESLHWVIIGLILMVFALGSIGSERFATLANIFNVQDQLVVLAIIALAQTLVILSGGIDLSFAGMLGLLCVFFAGFNAQDTQTLALAIAATLALGAFLGGINGVITAYVGVHPFIVTLGTSTVLTGLALLHSNQPSGSVALFFEDVVYARIAGVPCGFIFVICLYALTAFMLWRSNFGIRLYAIGNNEVAAQISGVPVKQTKVLVYAVSGLLAALAAIYMVGRFGVGDPRAGVGFDLRSITPVIVGGTLLAGGFGGVLGTALAVILLSLLANALNLMNVSSFYQWIVEGLIIICAVSVLVGRSKK
ncbi:MAG: ABC transporter permease [Oceanospirillaceae bacterium]|nr:ABC transporter permease [Oceanospirillaceae bacterium]